VSRLPTYYLSHGGGPWPYMKAEFGHLTERLEQSLFAIRRELGDAPRAVLMVTAHWERPGLAVSSAERPGMEYDYFGFPEHTYHIKYGAPGSPELAARVQSMLGAGRFGCAADPDRGFDHGTFSLMKPLYPDEDMPLVQLSILDSFDPETHLAVGRLLAPLRDEGVLVVGSGSSTHNLRQRSPSALTPTGRFDSWLQESLVGAAPADRLRRLTRWTEAPAAREVHPREDHLMPLMVAVGAAEDEPGVCVYHEDDFIGAWSLSSFRFGEAPAQPA
jgi:aromatic ring-opening dioxygenase catalytic subunit (LigB family)